MLHGQALIVIHEGSPRLTSFESLSIEKIGFGGGCSSSVQLHCIRARVPGHDFWLLKLRSQVQQPYRIRLPIEVAVELCRPLIDSTSAILAVEVPRLSGGGTILHRGIGGTAASAGKMNDQRSCHVATILHWFLQHSECKL